MKKTTITFFILIALNILTISVSVLQRNEFENRLWTQNSAFVEMKYELEDLRNKEVFAISTNGVTLSDSVVNLLSHYPYILRLHKDLCISCYADNLIRLKESLEEKEKNLFILGSYASGETFKNEISMIQGKFVNSCNISELEIMPADSLGISYIFHINGNGKIDHLHFIGKYSFETTQQYLKAASRLSDFRGNI